ncbi:MAG TPA: hypothetical protein VKA46_06585 [Gemmataceae bacterium]|nr:hypothetical protein [Gemmataceae bacterium]
MSTDPAPVRTLPAPPPKPAPTIHEAERASGASGAVLRGVEIDFTAAVVRRRAGEDVVVCGSDLDANRRLAYKIESGVGPASRPQTPHRRAGPLSLPHFHQVTRSPDGHTFYETENRKTRKKP